MKRTLLLLIIVVLTFGIGFAKKKNHKDVTIYAYGLSTCFNDSTAYLTDIIQIDNAYLLPKTKFLGGRHDYTEQLKNYFQNRNMPNQVCTFFYAKKRSKIEKVYVKLRNRLITKENKTIVQINSDEFSFKPVVFEE